MTRSNRKWLLKERPKGMPDREHFELIEEAIPELGNGQFLVRNWSKLLVTRARMQGILVSDFAAHFGRAAKELGGWVAEGKLKDQVDIVAGLENAPDAFRRLFTGENIGKQLVRIAEPEAV